MKKNLRNVFKKKFNLNAKKLIGQPLEILKKINIEKLREITSISLTEKYKNFKKKIKQKEKDKVQLLEKQRIKDLKDQRIKEHKKKIEETKLIKQNELNLLNEEKKK